MTETEHDENLMFIFAIEGYSQRYNMPEKDVISLFLQHGINHLIRKNYKALHTQDLDESIAFAEDILLTHLTHKHNFECFRINLEMQPLLFSLRQNKLGILMRNDLALFFV